MFYGRMLGRSQGSAQNRLLSPVSAGSRDLGSGPLARNPKCKEFCKRQMLEPRSPDGKFHDPGSRSLGTSEAALGTALVVNDIGHVSVPQLPQQSSACGPPCQDRRHLSSKSG